MIEQFIFNNIISTFLFFLIYFTDLQFPIDLSNVAKDHPFLENDPLQSLYRRLVALNRCATMRLDSAHKHTTNVSFATISTKQNHIFPYVCIEKSISFVFTKLLNNPRLN